MINEIWKDIPNFNGRYQASNFGNIRRCSRFDNAKLEHKIRKTFKPEKILVGNKLSTRGYKRISLLKKQYFVHRIVALAFIQNPHNFEQINHIDGNKLNNNINNLEWCSNSENRKHAVENGLIAKGEALSHLKEHEIIAIRNLYENNISQRHIGILFNIKQQTVSKIVNLKTWKCTRV